MKLEFTRVSLAIGVGALVISFAVGAPAGTGSAPISIIPAPQDLLVTRGSFVVTKRVRLVFDEASKASGEYLAERLRKSTGDRYCERLERLGINYRKGFFED